MGKNVISVDWFQYYALNERRSVLQIDTYFKGKPHPVTGYDTMYCIKGCKEPHALYRLSYTICSTDGSLVHIYMMPKMSALNPLSVSIKVANRLLYKRDWSFYLHDIIDYFGFTIKNITRLDIAIDFQYFDYEVWKNADGIYLERENHPKDAQHEECLKESGYTKHYLHPSEFIHCYLNDGEYNNAETFVREGSNKFCCYGSKELHATNGEKEINDDTEIHITSMFDYVRWGSRSSGVCTYLYNKSEELRSKHSKPWIKERWEKAGLNEEEGDVYRLEFSIQQKGMILTKKDRKAGMEAPKASDFIRLTADMVATQEKLDKLFWSYAYKYFSFRLVGKQKYRKNMKRITLFDVNIVPELLPTTISHRINAGRAEKNAARCIERLSYSHVFMSGNDQFILWRASEILQRFGVEKTELSNTDLEKVKDMEEAYERGDLSEGQKHKIYALMAEKIAFLTKYFDDPLIAQRTMELESAEQIASETILGIEREWKEYKWKEQFIFDVPF